MTEARVGPLREMGGRAELKGRRWARGRKRSWARRKGWVGPGAREKKREGVGLGPVVGFWAGFSSFPFWAEVGLGPG